MHREHDLPVTVLDAAARVALRRVAKPATVRIKPSARQSIDPLKAGFRGVILYDRLRHALKVFEASKRGLLFGFHLIEHDLPSPHHWLDYRKSRRHVASRRRRRKHGGRLAASRVFRHAADHDAEHRLPRAG